MDNKFIVGWKQAIIIAIFWIIIACILNYFNLPILK